MRNMLQRDLDQIENRNVKEVVKQHAYNPFSPFTVECSWQINNQPT